MNSLEPCDNPDYILISKRAFLINTFVIAKLSEALSKFVNLNSEDIGEEVGDFARKKVNELSEETVQASVQSILDNLGTDSGITIVEYSHQP